MANLRDLRTRIRSIKSTQKITSAMKMVAAAKLRSAQERVEAIRPYETNMQGMVSHLLSQQQDLERRPLLLTGHPDINKHLLVIVTTNRGLCGGFNSVLAREAKTIIRTLQDQGKNVEIFSLGRKGRNLLRHDYEPLFFEIDLDEAVKEGPDEQDHKMLHSFQESLMFSTALQMLVEQKRFGEFSILFTIFRSALHQDIAHHPLIPFPLSSGQADSAQENLHRDGPDKTALYEYEPSPDSLLSHLLKRYLAVHFYRVLLENHASEQGARMMAMDNATRNAQDIIQSLERTYHQTRQAFITKELIEIISAAEAM